LGSFPIPHHHTHSDAEQILAASAIFPYTLHALPKSLSPASVHSYSFNKLSRQFQTPTYLALLISNYGDIHPRIFHQQAIQNQLAEPGIHQNYQLSCISDYFNHQIS
jgi:hypothetical protein